jgi:hypothetical protein
MVPIINLSSKSRRKTPQGRFCQAEAPAIEFVVHADRNLLSVIPELNWARMGINDAGVFSMPLGLEPAFVLRFCQNRL